MTQPQSSLLSYLNSSNFFHLDDFPLSALLKKAKVDYSPGIYELPSREVICTPSLTNSVGNVRAGGGGRTLFFFRTYIPTQRIDNRFSRLEPLLSRTFFFLLYKDLFSLPAFS